VLGLGPRRKQLQEIGEWMRRDDFPRKSPKGWTVEDLLAWREKVWPELLRAKAMANLLAQGKNPTKRDIELVRTISAPFTGGEPVGAGSVEEFPTKVSGQQAMAALINQKYKVRCSRMDIQKWRGVAPEPFPAPDARNDYEVAACFAWYEKYKLPRVNGNGTTPDLFVRLEEETARNDLEGIEHERWQRDLERGAYLKRDVAVRTVAGALKQYHGFVKSAMEHGGPATRREKLQGLGVAAEVVSAFYEFDLLEQRKVTDAIEAECSVLADGHHDGVPTTN
jgi:hypothetical protein